MKHAIACAIALGLIACSRSSSAPASGGRHAWSVPGTLRVAVGEEPKNLNPLLAVTTVDVFIDRLMFEPLLSADPHGNPVPMLATQVPTIANGGISKDGLTIVYHLRSDAKWSDGTPVTSHDVAWSWHAVADPDNNVISRHGYDVVRAIDTPGDRTVVVHLRHRFAPFVNTFFAESDQPYEIAPAHVLSRFSNINQVPFNAAPAVGDGPFVFESWKRGDRILLHANAHFFRGRPGLDRVEIAFVADENTAVNLLRTHSIDYLFQASVATYPALSQLPDTRIVWNSMNGYEAVEFNLAHPVVSDPRIRLAIAQAIDKHALVTVLTHGQEKVATEDIPDWMWAFDPNVKSHAFDLAAAKALMVRAGYAYGSDGIARKDGAPLHLLLTTDSVDATHRSESVLLQAALRRIGIVLDVKYFPQAQMYATAALGGILQGGKFDLALSPWYAGIDPDDSSQFLCSTIAPAGYNSSRYCTREMDAAQHVALDRYDRAMRAVAYSRIERLLERDNPYVFIWWQRQQEALSVDFKGFAPNPVVESWNAWQWKV